MTPTDPNPTPLLARIPWRKGFTWFLSNLMGWLVVAALDTLRHLLAALN